MNKRSMESKYDYTIHCGFKKLVELIMKAYSDSIYENFDNPREEMTRGQAITFIRETHRRQPDEKEYWFEVSEDPDQEYVGAVITRAELEGGLNAENEHLKT